MRLFVAIDISEPARRQVAKTQSTLRTVLSPGAEMKWVGVDQAHLTLVFLGQVDDARATAVVEAMTAAVPMAPFDISLERLGVFPDRGAPRVLWIGVGRGAGAVIELQREIAARAVRLGIPSEQRPFHPHLTLARWRASRPADRARALSAPLAAPIASGRIEAATVYQSRLSPGGSTYTPLAHATLTGR